MVKVYFLLPPKFVVSYQLTFIIFMISNLRIKYQHKHSIMSLATSITELSKLTNYKLNFHVRRINCVKKNCRIVKINKHKQDNC